VAVGLAWKLLELGLNELWAVRLEELEKLCVLHDGHLHDLCRAVGELPLVKGRQEAAIENRERRRQVRAELVLLSREIDPRLCTDTCVNVAHERCRHTDVWRSSAIDGSGKANDVHADAAPDGDDRVEAAVEPKLMDSLCDLEDHVHVLVLLCGGQDKRARLHPMRIEVCVDPIAMQRVDRIVNNHNALQCT